MLLRSSRNSLLQGIRQSTLAALVQSGTNITSFTCSSISPDPNATVVMVVMQRRSGNPITPTVKGCGVPWYPIIGTGIISAGTTYRSSFFIAQGFGLATDTPVIDFGGESQARIVVGIYQFKAYNPGAVVVCRNIGRTADETPVNESNVFNMMSLWSEGSGIIAAAASLVPTGTGVGFDTHFTPLGDVSTTLTNIRGTVIWNDSAGDARVWFSRGGGGQSAFSITALELALVPVGQHYAPTGFFGWQSSPRPWLIAPPVGPIEISVFDDDPVSESVVVVVNPLTIAVSDDDVASEAVTVQIPMQAVVFDDDVASEVVTVRIQTQVVVFDDDAASDVATVQIPMQVVVFDDDVASESVLVATNSLSVVVFDDDVAGDVATVQIPMQVVVVDDDAASESVVLVFFTPPVVISVFDDDTSPSLDPPPMPATGIARDYIDVEEGLGMGLGLPVLVEDSVSPASDAVIYLSIPVRVVDEITVSDVIDTDAVTINPVLVGFDQVVMDVVAPVDVVTLVRVLAIDVSDSVMPAEAVAAALPMSIVAVDDSPTIDTPRIESQLHLVAFDDRPIDEEVAALVSVLLASVSDEILGEDLVLAGIPMAVSVMDVPEEGAVGERRHVSIPRFYEDLHFINDAILEPVTSAGALRSGQVQDTHLGLSNRVRDAGLKESGSTDEALEG